MRSRTRRTGSDGIPTRGSRRLYGVVAAVSHTPFALGAWLLGIAAALAATTALGLWRGIAWSAADARLVVPGSWLPLVMILALFVIKFGVGVMLAMNPGFALDAGFAATVGLAYGTFSGLFLGRGVVMWRVAQRHLQPGLGVRHPAQFTTP